MLVSAWVSIWTNSMKLMLPSMSLSACLTMSEISSSPNLSPKFNMQIRNSSLEIFPSPSVSKALKHEQWSASWHGIGWLYNIKSRLITTRKSLMRRGGKKCSNFVQFSRHKTQHSACFCRWWFRERDLTGSAVSGAWSWWPGLVCTLWTVQSKKQSKVHIWILRESVLQINLEETGLTAQPTRHLFN